MEKIKIYLDEDVRPLLAEILRDRGYDVISCVEKKIFGLSDEEQLKTAINDERAFLTHNIKDYIQLHKKLKGEHFGIILSDQISFSVVLRRLLKFLATTSLENLRGKLIWLSNYK
jgi:predicted nuclease of predicted toxin-antitoxin system